MKRSKHNLSHYRLLTCDMGELVPCGLTEVLPGDTIQHATSMLVRASPMVTPPMHPVSIRVHHWYVPHRLVWEDWEKFITGGEDGMDASVFPTMDVGPNANVGTLSDYLGVPSDEFDAVNVSALPFRAYNMIFNEWYRDQDLTTPAVISRTSGLDVTTGFDLREVAWEKDYFTTARPWEQKGPTVTLPLGTSAPIVRPAGAGPAGSIRVAATGAFNAIQQGLFGGPPARAGQLEDAGGGTPMAYDPEGSLIADLSGATSVSVNAVREAFALQRFAEARARYGSRYTEYLRYLGVRSSDARLQRPEYLGGGKQSLQFSEVLQTGSTTAEPDGVGQLYGHGIAALRSNRYRRFIEEHGYIVSLLHILPRTMYPQGLQRTWSRRVKEDFYQRELEHIGQQTVMTTELFSTADPATIFGFQDRYDEYRRAESSVHGEFRTILDDWHFARIFGAAPVLNDSFVTANPAKRPFQVQDGVDTMLVLCNHQLVARRLLGKSGTSFIF